MTPARDRGALPRSRPGLSPARATSRRGGLPERTDETTFPNVGQAEVAAAVAVGQSFVVDAHEVEDRGVEVVDVDLVLDGVPAESSVAP